MIVVLCVVRMLNYSTSCDVLLTCVSLQVLIIGGNGRGGLLVWATWFPQASTVRSFQAQRRTSRCFVEVFVNVYIEYPYHGSFDITCQLQPETSISLHPGITCTENTHKIDSLLTHSRKRLSGTRKARQNLERRCGS